MNRFTVCFDDQFLEKQFQAYQQSNYRLYMIQTYKIAFVQTLSYSMIALTGSDYIEGISCMLLAIFQIGRSKMDMSKAFMVHNIFLIIYPEATLVQCLNQGTSDPECVTLLLITQIIIQSGIIQQNILFASLQFINMLVANIFVVYWRFGFCKPQYIMVLYYIYWLIQEYQRISINRSNFIASQVNDSIYEIFKNITTSPVLIFNYDQEHLVFKLEQLFNVEIPHFNLQSLLTKVNTSNKKFHKEICFRILKVLYQWVNQKYKIINKIGFICLTYPKTKFIIKLSEQLPVNYPEELKYEQRLVSHYFSQIKFTERLNQFAKFQKIQQQLQIRLNLNRMMISYKFSKYQVKKSVLKIIDLIRQVADMFKLSIAFPDSQNPDMQLILDPPLIQTLIQSILYLMNVKQNLVNCYLYSNQESVYQIVFYSMKKIDIKQEFATTRFYQNMNYLAKQLSFSDLEISEYKIKLDILKISLSEVFL